MMTVMTMMTKKKSFDASVMGELEGDSVLYSGSSRTSWCHTSLPPRISVGSMLSGESE